MRRARRTTVILALATLGLGAAVTTPALAREERLELWLNPSVTVDVGDKTFVEVETVQRLRGEPADDTYYARLWLGRKIGGGVTLSAGIERRHEGQGREIRALQQLSYPLPGPFKGRTRLEQRFLKDAPQTAWRLRQRLGASIPLSRSERSWELAANVEGFFTLRASTPGAQTGLTAVRTFVGVEKEWDRVEVSLGYLRAQTVRTAAPDTVGHAPFVGLGFTF